MMIQVDLVVLESNCYLSSSNVSDFVDYMSKIYLSRRKHTCIQMHTCNFNDGVDH